MDLGSRKLEMWIRISGGSSFGGCGCFEDSIDTDDFLDVRIVPIMSCFESIVKEFCEMVKKSRE